VTIRAIRDLNLGMPQTNDDPPAIGIIGGSGLYQMEELRETAEHKIDTRLDRLRTCLSVEN